MQNFKTWLEATDIFGFDRKKDAPEKDDVLDNKPTNVFDVEEMMSYLSKKKVGINSPRINFMNEIQWGTRSGAIKVEVNPNLTFHIKKLGFDLNGNARWVSKKMFQLNRKGFGGYEDSVANEIYDHVKDTSTGGLEAPNKKFEGLQDLVHHMARKMRHVAKDIFLWNGIKRVNENNYLIVFNVRGQGVQARDQKRVEENITQVSFDESDGCIHVTNYKVASSLGQHEWKVMPSDLDLYFFPSQDRDEISETVAVHIKYY